MYRADYTGYHMCSINVFSAVCTGFVDSVRNKQRHQLGPIQMLQRLINAEP